MLKISRMASGEPEIFLSIQGEGISAGTPSVFLRTSMCNLSCTWCDTKYTWDWEHFQPDDETILLSREEAESRVLAFQRPHLVITGGEPLLQQRELAPLAASLSQRGYYCEVETNGTLAPTPEMAEAVSQWNVSPKISSSGNRTDLREVHDSLAAFRELDNACFKFVVVEPADVEEVRRLVDVNDIDPNRVLLMPEGVTPQAVRERGEWVAEACVRHGYRFTTRLHILLWGDQRGR